MLDYYALLEVDEEADATTIKKSFRVLAKKYHPDLNPDDEEAEKKFIQINEAYNILSDTKARAKYDASRKKGPDRTKQKKQTTNEEQPQYKYNDSEYAKVNFENWDDQFESFFGFNPHTNEVHADKIRKKESKPTSNRAFEEFFGFRKPKK